MIQETISISEFRLKLSRLCRAVRRGKKELTVTRYGEDLFKVVKSDDKADVAIGITCMRDHTGEFIRTLEENKTVVLSEHERPCVRCVLL